MFPRCVILISFLSMLCVGADLAPDSRPSDASRASRFRPLSEKAANAALFVGVNEFSEDSAIAPLQYAVNDAVAMAHLLVLELRLVQPERSVLAISGAPSGGAAKQLEELRAAHIMVLPATKPKILKQLRQLAGLPQNTSDMLLLQMSSHGSEEHGEAYVLPADGVSTALDDTALNVKSLERAMSDTKAGRKILLLDACRNRPLVSSRGDAVGMSAAFRKSLEQAQGSAILASCDVGQVSWEDPSVENGVFTHFLLKGLRGEASPDGSGMIRLASIEHYVALSVDEWSKKNGKYPVQHPWFKGPDIVRQTALAIDPGMADLLKKRVARLKSLALDDKLTMDQFQEAQRLLQTGAADETQAKRLMMYERVGDNKLDVETALIVLEKLPLSDATPRPVKVPEPPAAAPVVREERDGRLTLLLTAKIGMTFVRVPKGEVIMGSRAEGAWKETGRVTVDKAFYLGVHEVTNAQFRCFQPDHDSGSSQSISFNLDNQPVVQVSWQDATAFCTWLSKETKRNVRLPTQAEWQQACLAGGRGPFSFGSDVKDMGKNAWYQENGGGISHEVGTKPPNALGLFDMHGNVWEWCQDGEGQTRGVRGGSWSTPYLKLPSPTSFAGDILCMACDQALADPITVENKPWKHNNLGFRVAVSP